MAWGVGVGDAVFVPDFTFFATAEVVARLGATPVFVDIEKDTYNMNPADLERAIEKIREENRLTPKVIIAVDLFGQPADYLKIEKIARQQGILLLEDAAQGFGGRINGRNAGINACSFGDVAGTSFFPAKPLGCYGDGGAVFTNDDELERYLRSAAVHGKGADKYDNVLIGLNSRLDTLQAAILIPKLAALRDYELENVNKAAEKYNELLDGFVGTPQIKSGFYSSWAQYSILLKDSTERQRVIDTLKAADIPSKIYYNKPLHRQPAFSQLANCDAEFPVATEVCGRILSLPIHPYLDGAAIELICKTLKSALSEKAKI
jgi:dTDP-4-amino-4,6-dideoxygalactose transaminase